MTEKIIDIKNKILKDNFHTTEFNYLDFENISQKVYKDYGKLFFDKGLLPRTIDNYSLQDFTVEGREFSFLCIPTSVCEKSKLIDTNFRKKEKKEEIYKTPQKNENKFVFSEDEFPPLK